MADIREGLQGISEPDRSIGLLLDEMYRNMRSLERDDHRAGKQAVAIVMTLNDIKAAVGRSLQSRFDELRKDPDHHLGLGDIRLTVAQQDELCESLG